MLRTHLESRRKETKLCRWDLVRVQWLAVSYLYLDHYALDTVPIMCLAKDLRRGTSDLFRLLARATNFTLGRCDLVWVQWLAVDCSHFLYYASEMAPDHAYCEGLLGSTSDLLRLLALTNQHQLCRWDFVWVPWLGASCSHLQYYAVEIAPDHVSGEGLARLPLRIYFDFSPSRIIWQLCRWDLVFVQWL